MKITIELEILPDEVGLAAELLSTLRYRVRASMRSASRRHLALCALITQATVLDRVWLKSDQFGMDNLLMLGIHGRVP